MSTRSNVRVISLGLLLIYQSGKRCVKHRSVMQCLEACVTLSQAEMII